MTAGRSHELDFGSLEKMVRWVEETPPAVFERELTKRLGKLHPGDVDPWVRYGALAAARSVRHDGARRMPQSLPVLSAIRALAQGRSPEEQRLFLGYALRLVHRELQDPGLGPYRMLTCAEAPGEGREGTLFSFLEAVRAGETDWADHRFAWLVRNLEKEQVIDLLLSSGLEGVTVSAERVTAVVEMVSLLQGIGWEQATVLLRPVVRHQAGGMGGTVEYERCRDLVERRDLLRLARRRPPGQAAMAERDHEGFLREAMAWAESRPEERTARAVEALAGEVPLEDMADLTSMAATLILVQEILRRRETPPGEAEFARAVALVTGVMSLCRLVRLGTPGQRILALLLAGWVAPARDLRLDTRAPDCGWWLSPVAQVREPSLPPSEEPSAPAPAAWGELIQTGQPNGLLPLLTARLEGGLDASGLEEVLVPLAPRFEEVGGGAVRLVRTLTEAYRGARTPHRWVHLWAASLALALWPRGEESRAGTGDLSEQAGVD